MKVPIQRCTGLACSLHIKYCRLIRKSAFYGCDQLKGVLAFYDYDILSLTTISN